MPCFLPGSETDINPQKYGDPRDPHTAPDDPLRDNVDELLLQDAYNMHKPLLGICFGLQSLNVWCSGTLVQHLDTGVRHSSGTDEQAPTHRVTVDPKSRLATIVADAVRQSPNGELTVLSSHHQSAARAGGGLRPVAWCPDDQVIEALEGISPDHWVVAVQWHPERMTEDPAALALFRAFVDAARNHYSNPRTTTLDFESVAR